jgi:hypothetical protein
MLLNILDTQGSPNPNQRILWHWPIPSSNFRLPMTVLQFIHLFLTYINIYASVLVDGQTSSEKLKMG